MNWKKAIEDYEYTSNGFTRISGKKVKAVNIKQSRDMIKSDILYIDDACNSVERYNKVSYPKDFLMGISENIYKVWLIRGMPTPSL